MCVCAHVCVFDLPPSYTWLFGQGILPNYPIDCPIGPWADWANRPKVYTQHQTRLPEIISYFVPHHMFINVQQMMQKKFIRRWVCRCVPPKDNTKNVPCWRLPCGNRRIILYCSENPQCCVLVRRITAQQSYEFKNQRHAGNQ